MRPCRLLNLDFILSILGGWRKGDSGGYQRALNKKGLYITMPF